MKQAIFIILILFYATALDVYAINPEKEYKAKPDRFGIPYTEEKISTTDGLLLNSWIFTPDSINAKTTIVISGSDAGNMGYFIGQAAYLRSLQYRVITFDYRGFGSSSDFPMDKDMLYYDEFVVDLLSVIKNVHRNYPNDKIGVYGLSMGTIIALSSATQDTNISFCILDGVIIKPLQVIDRLEKKKNKKIKYPQSGLTFENKIKAVKTPMLLFASVNDDITSIDDCISMLSTDYNRTLIVHNAAHLMGINKIPAYTEYIKSFIENH